MTKTTPWRECLKMIGCILLIPIFGLIYLCHEDKND